jgi:hypothetical protein
LQSPYIESRRSLMLRLDERPGAHVLRLLLQPHDVLDVTEPLELRADLLLGERVELLDADGHDVRRLHLLSARR